MASEGFAEKGKKRHSQSDATSLSTKLRTHFRVLRSLEPIFSGSQVRITSDGRFLLCDCGDAGVKIVDSNNASVVGVIIQPEETITAFCCFPLETTIPESSFIVVTASHNCLLRQWHVTVDDSTSLAHGQACSAHITLIRSWKAQPATPAGRICALETDATNSILASGATDGSVRVWDLERKTCTHFLRGHTGVVSLLRFFSEDDRHILLTSAVGDGQLRAWNLTAASSDAFTLLSGHSSVVTDATWTESGDKLITISRDQLLVVWDGRTFEKLRSWPCFEQLEAVLIKPSLEHTAVKKEVQTDSFHVITAGSRGQLRVWDVSSGKCIGQSAALGGSEVTKQNESETSVGILATMLLGGSSSIVCSSSDHRLIFYDVTAENTFEEKKQIPGDVGEVLDINSIRFSEHCEKNEPGLLAVATNSPLIRLYDSSDWSCTFLHGHKAAVTSLASSFQGTSCMLVSGSRDNDVLVWQISFNAERQIKANLIGRAAGHTAAVLTVASMPGGKFFVSGGVDLTIKLWSLPQLSPHRPSTLEALSCSATAKAHDKDINSLALSPNGRFLASGSQDRTAKIWQVENDQGALQLLGILRGHRRAIWSVDFSPIDQVLATSSADGTLKLWALSNLACLRTFEGHEVAVLRCRFLSRGAELVSGGADGVVKAWSLQTGECVMTLDTGHDDRAWAVTPIADGEWLATGSADDHMIVWQDFTAEHVSERTKQEHARALDTQRLDNLLAGRNFAEAFSLALSLNQPARLWRIIRELRLLCDGSAPTDENSLTVIVANLDSPSLAQLLRIISAWNTNTRFALEAQFLLNIILQKRSIDDILGIVRDDVPGSDQQLLRDAVEALIVYTQRHFARVDRLATQSYFIDFAWSQLKLLDEVPST